MALRDPWLRALVVIMVLIAAVYLTGLIWQIAVQFADLILLFFLAWLISFVLEPLVAVLHRRTRVPRNLAVLAAYLVVLVTVTVAIVQLLPRLSAQVVLFVNELPLYAAWANGELLRLQESLARQGIFIDPESLLTYQEVVRRVEALGPLVVANAVGLATGLASVLFQVFIILILSYYMTLDGRRITNALLLAIPGAYRRDAHYFLESVHRSFAGFIRGTLAQAAIYSVGTAAVMAAADLKLVLLPSVAAGALMLIPFIGPVLAIVVPLLIAAVSRPDAFLAVLVALFVLQQIVVNVIAPRLMSQTVGLHPLLIFLAVLGGAKLAGVWGAFFGIPIVGVVSAMASFYRTVLEDRQAGRPESEPPAGPERRARIVPLAASPASPPAGDDGPTAGRGGPPVATVGATAGPPGKEPSY